MAKVSEHLKSYRRRYNSNVATWSLKQVSKERVTITQVYFTSTVSVLELLR